MSTGNTKPRTKIENLVVLHRDLDESILHLELLTDRITGTAIKDQEKTYAPGGPVAPEPQKMISPVGLLDQLLSDTKERAEKIRSCITRLHDSLLS